MNDTIKPTHKQSKFIVSMPSFGEFVLLYGKLPKKDGQLWKGETDKGEKMEFAGNSDDPEWPTPYWGWSS